MAWLLRGVTAASVLVLAACGGGTEPRGELSMAPRPELTAPPGEMTTQRLVLMKATTGENKGKSIGSIAIAPEGAGVLLRLELRNLNEGAQVLSFNEEANCTADEINGETVPAASAGRAWGPDDKPIDLPALDVPSDGQLRTEMLVRRIKVGDTRGRSLVITKGGVRVGCGIAQ